MLAATAAAQRDGKSAPATSRVMRRFLHQVPALSTPPGSAPKRAGQVATRFRPDQFSKPADSSTDTSTPTATTPMRTAPAAAG